MHWLIQTQTWRHPNTLFQEGTNFTFLEEYVLYMWQYCSRVAGSAGEKKNNSFRPFYCYYIVDLIIHIIYLVQKTYENWYPFDGIVIKKFLKYVLKKHHSFYLPYKLIVQCWYSRSPIYIEFVPFFILIQLMLSIILISCGKKDLNFICARLCLHLPYNVAYLGQNFEVFGMRQMDFSRYLRLHKSPAGENLCVYISRGSPLLVAWWRKLER